MENQDQNIKTENEHIIQNKTKKRKKKKLFLILNFKLKNYKEKEELILKSKADIGDFVLSTLSKK